MGQQQLLLLVIGVVLVGLATVVAINAFGQARREAELDALNDVALSVSADLYAWFAKPPVFGGGGRAVCPFTPPPDVHGRPVVVGEPFAGVPGRFPSPGAGAWIDAGSGRFAQLDASRDVIRVVSRTHGDLALELQVLGPDAACVSARRADFRDGAWQMAAHAPASDCPALW